MKLYVIIMVLLLAVPVIGFVEIRMKTVREISKIRELEGQAGEFNVLVRSIRTHYSVIEDPKELETARIKLGLADWAGLILFRFNGEGFPYYYGYVVYDTHRKMVIKTEARKLSDFRK